MTKHSKEQGSNREAPSSQITGLAQPLSCTLSLFMYFIQPSFSVDSGSAVMVAGSYVVRAVQTQVVPQGAARREIWLGVDLLRGGATTTGWVQSGELQRRVAGDGDWLTRLRGEGRGGWSVEEHSWVCSGGPTMTGHGLRGAMVGHGERQGV